MQMDKLRGLLGIRKLDKVPNTRIIVWCRVTKRVDERIKENFLLCFGIIKRMEYDGIFKRIYVRECVGSCLVSRPRKK